MNTVDPTFSFLTVIIGIAFLIVFFIMASNISKTKRYILDIRKIAMMYAEKDNIDISGQTKKKSE
jgi:hypothetical protein